MVRLLNIGNTHTQVGLLRSGAVILERTVPTPDLLLEALSGSPAAGGGPCLVACVVPAARERLSTGLAGHAPVFLDAGLVTEVDFSLVDTSTLGADRVANAVTAAVEVGGPVLVLDCGTCITTEAVDAERRFRGGAILPGRGLLRRALHDHTGQLPRVAWADDCPAALGTCTRDAILAGVDLGVLGAVERLVHASRLALGHSSCPVLAVGGDAAFFCRHLPGLTPGGGLFTLRGMAQVARRCFAADAD